jgi:hypothetical protein
MRQVVYAKELYGGPERDARISAATVRRANRLML